MTQDFKKARGVEPTQLELEFLFALMMRGLNPTEIFHEYQGTEFPPRQRRWIAGKQRYFDAARKILGTSSLSSALITQTRKQHFEDLCALIERLNRVIKLVSVDIYETEKNGDIYWRCLIEQGVPAEMESDVVVQQDNGTIVRITVLLESHPLFQRLESHLDKKIWSLYPEWKDCLDKYFKPLAEKDKSWTQKELDGFCKKWQQISEDLSKALTVVQYKRTFSGKCDMCPEELTAEKTKD